MDSGDGATIGLSPGNRETLPAWLAVLASTLNASRRNVMETWGDLLFGNPYGLSSIIVILCVLGIGGWLAWFFISRSRGGD